MTMKYFPASIKNIVPISDEREESNLREMMLGRLPRTITPRVWTGELFLIICLVLRGKV